MPETLVTHIDRIRVRDEVLNIGEAALNFVFSAEIVRHISEILSAVEDEANRVEWSWAINEVANSNESLHRVIGALEDFLREIIDDAVNVSEVVYAIVGATINPGLVEIVGESINVVESTLRSRARAFNTVWRMQIDEVLDPTVFLVRVEGDVLNIISGSAHVVIVVAFELVQITSDVITSLETTLRPILLGRTIDETINIVTTTRGLVWQSAQIVFDWVVRPAIRFSVWINKDSG